MNYNEIFPFIRPNYYKGKQLTVRDFREEHGYLDSKLRALRCGVCGAGVVSGFDVVAVDDENYSVECGYAFDRYGRDICIDVPVLRNITATDGFDAVDAGSEVYLCAEYSELPMDKTSPMYDSSRTEYDRYREGCRLFFTNERPRGNINGLSAVAETVTELYRAEGLTVYIVVPKYVSAGESLAVTVAVDKHGLDKSVSAEINVHCDSFSDGTGVIYYNAEDTCDHWEQRIYLPPRSRNAGMNKVTATAADIKIIVGEEQVPCLGATAATEVIDELVSERLRREYFHLDVMNDDSLLYLAQFYLDNGGKRIGMIRTLPFDQYIHSAPIDFIMSRIPKQPEMRQQSAGINDAVLSAREPAANNISSGVESIDITNDYRGKIYYSSEIVHGLGEGSVSYSVGFECVDSFSGDADDTVVFGDPSLFEGTPYSMDFPKIQYSIISYNSKGTFRIAVRLLDRINAGSIRLHWVAVRAQEQSAKDMMDVEKVSISIKPNLVNIEPRETVGLECIIEGTDNTNCIWDVADKNGGTISRNGIYKAPSAEGVYTVTATSVKYPTKKAVNYIIVSKRKEI